MCFGQEFTVANYPWAESENTGADIDYCRAYKRICHIYDRIINSGTQRRVWFSWNGTYKWINTNYDVLFPNTLGTGGAAENGDSLSNYQPLQWFTIDCYDKPGQNGSPFSNDAGFQNWAGTYTLTGTGGATKGPRGACRWAESKGLYFGIQEYGPAPTGSPTPSVNYTWYINGMWRMHNEIAARTNGDKYFEILFNQSPPDLKHQLWPRTTAVTWNLENVSDEYKRLWTP
jgi:hypothetical protein